MNHRIKYDDSHFFFSCVLMILSTKFFSHPAHALLIPHLIESCIIGNHRFMKKRGITASIFIRYYLAVMQKSTDNKCIRKVEMYHPYYMILSKSSSKAKVCCHSLGRCLYYYKCLIQIF